MRQRQHRRRPRAGSAAGVVILLAALAAPASAGPLPMPLLCRLDLAREIYVGKIAKIEKLDERHGDGVILDLATVSVRETLKGERAETLKFRVVTFVSPDYGGSSPPAVRKAGDDGIWLMGAPDAELPEMIDATRLEEVRKLTALLKARQWSEPVGGLTAWASIVELEYERGRQVLVFAVRNASDKTVYVPGPYPEPCITVRAVDRQGRVLEFNVYRPGGAAPPATVTCQALKPGQTAYLHPDWSFISIPRSLPAGQYQVTVTLANRKDGQAMIERRWQDVKAWKGELSAPAAALAMPTSRPASGPATAPGRS